MIIVKKEKLLKEYLSAKKDQGLSIGFVPTLGALHAGHLQLVKTAITQTDESVCSIFINPTQFNDPADFNKYPQTLTADIHLLEPAKTNILFVPGVEEIYPEGTGSLEKYELGFIETILEGKYRPGHFQGVCQVMQRLLEMVMPDKLFMGQKDYQQCMVVEKLISLLHIPVELVKCPTLREADGLAMSSRNTRLVPEQRQIAPAIFRTLTEINKQYGKISPAELKSQAIGFLTMNGFRVDYVEIADADTLEPLTEWQPGRPAVALVAAFLGEVRLIDNMMLG